jgi:hypothetical protein
MHGSASGPLGALLLIAPLAAIPVFAIVGVPQFAPLSASPSDDEEFTELGDSTSSHDPVPAGDPAKSRCTDDVFAPLSDSPTRQNSGSSASPSARQFAGSSDVRDLPNNAGQSLPPAEALDDWEIRSGTATIGVPKRGDDSPGKPGNPPRSSGRSSEELQLPADELEEGQVSAQGFSPDLLKPEPGRRPRSTRENGVGSTAPDQRLDFPKATNSNAADNSSPKLEMTAERSGWQAAARRLKELGIRKYRLEAQIEEQTFIFFCTFASPDDPRIVRKFEVEAETPLEAVQAVLTEIDEWRARGINDKLAAIPPED